MIALYSCCQNRACKWCQDETDSKVRGLNGLANPDETPRELQKKGESRCIYVQLLR